jgi:hypothetical protein
MSILGLMFLISALASAVLRVDRSPWEQGAFVTLLMLSTAAFVVSSLKRPSLVWAIIDDLHSQRPSQHQAPQAHSSKGN